MRGIRLGLDLGGRNLLSTVVAVTASYNTLMGTGVDSTGFASLPLRSGAVAFYVNPGTGSDANSGLTHALALNTMAAARAKVVNNRGDHILVREGSTTSEVLPNFSGLNGFSAAYPLMVQSYDPADPTNQAKWGLGYQRGARPILTAANHQFCGTLTQNSPNFVGYRGFNFNCTNLPDQVIGAVADGSAGAVAGSYWLFEGNIFNYVGMTFDMHIGTGLPPRTALTDTIIIRNNSFRSPWSAGAQTGSVIFLDGFKGSIVIEDNVISHGGWNESLTRADTTRSLGAADVYQHSIYAQSTNDAIVYARRNLIADGAADAGQFRCPHIVTENLMIDNPISISAGGGTSYSTYQPNGVLSEMGYNAILGDADITTAQPRGNAVIASNGTKLSSIHHNLFARSRNVASANGATFSVDAGFDVPSYHDFHSNVAYLWNNLTYTGGGAFPAQRFPTYENNYTDAAATGSNLNISSLTTPNAYTAATFYTAMFAAFPAIGAATKAAFIARALAYPEEHMQRVGRQTLFTGYAVPTACASLVLRGSWTVGTAATIMLLGVTPGSTLTGSLPAAFTLNSATRSIAYDGTGGATSGNFTITETPLIGTAKVNTVAYAVAASFATLDPAAITGTTTLSNGNLAATTAGATATGVRSTKTVTAGALIYCEAHIDAYVDAPSIALINSSGTFTPNFFFNTASANVASINAATNNARYNATTQAIGTVPAGAYLGLAYNDTTKKLYARVNGTWTGDPVAGTGGLDVTGIGSTLYIGFQGDNGDKMTFNFGATAYTYAAPSGYGNL